LLSIFDRARLDHLSRASAFTLREDSKITPLYFSLMITFGSIFGNKSLRSMCAVMGEKQTTKQALDQRFNVRAKEFSQAVFEQALTECLKRASKIEPCEATEQFSAPFKENYS